MISTITKPTSLFSLQVTTIIYRTIKIKIERLRQGSARRHERGA